jgi:hypothetical protein
MRYALGRFLGTTAWCVVATIRWVWAVKTVNPVDTINKDANHTPGIFIMKCYVEYRSEEWHRLNRLGWITWEVNPSEDGTEWATMVISSP